MATPLKNQESNAAPRQQRVVDEHGGVHDLGAKLAEGGQGVVIRIKGKPNLLVKVSKHPASHPMTVAWRARLEKLHYMPIEEMGLPVAMPRAMIVKPRPGYLMELMDGLVPLEQLLIESQEALLNGDGLQGFLASGGLRRRVALLARLARVLARLHGLGIAHGDLSPKNVFVSCSHEHTQVWLIDCDNLSYAVRDSDLALHTPDYGAPEILRGDAGISTYTDIWSFAVMAFELLTQLHPLKSGAKVDGDAELELPASKGQLPWIDHPDDDSNRTALGIDREAVCTPALRRLFDQCFRLGLNEPAERPVMAEWAEAFEAAAAVQITCEGPVGCCGSSFYWHRNRTCPFCGSEGLKGRWVNLRYFVLVPKSALPEGSAPSERWVDSKWQQIVEKNKVALHAAPPGSSVYADSEAVAQLWLDGDRLVLQKEGATSLAIRLTGSKAPAQRVLGRIELHREECGYTLHIGNVQSAHDVWRFTW